MASPASAMALPSRWALRPVTPEAGSVPHLLAATLQPTLIGRVCGDGLADASATDASTEGKIGLLAPGSAGISRTHAALEVSAESLTIAGRSVNLINVVRASGAAPLAVKRGEPPLALEGPTPPDFMTLLPPLSGSDEDCENGGMALKSCVAGSSLPRT